MADSASWIEQVAADGGVAAVVAGQRGDDLAAGAQAVALTAHTRVLQREQRGVDPLQLIRKDRPQPGVDLFVDSPDLLGNLAGQAIQSNT